MYLRCRYGKEKECPAGLQGWTDTGREPPNQVASAADEPKCDDGNQMRHGTPQQPVIYYDQYKRDAGLMIHEGLHAYSNPRFATEMRNGVNEGTTEYFTRQILPDLNIARPENTYDEELAEVNRLVPVVGEDSLARAYFKGEMEQLHQTANQKMGPCALDEFASAVQTLEFDHTLPRQIIEGNKNYCKDGETSPEVPKTSPAASPADEKPK